MSKKILITFGCSWTYGVGVNYTTNLTEQLFKENAWNADLCNTLSWRGIISKKFGYENKNFSRGGASNQFQFRLATNFFSSPEFKKIQCEYDEILVLWGITSVARGELYSLEHNRFYSFFLNENIPLSKFILKYCYDFHNEIATLNRTMLHWDDFFDALKIKHYWFDTFNHHDYDLFFTSKQTESILQLSDKYRDLASRLANDAGATTLSDQYHQSTWGEDCDKIKFLRDCGLVNPFSLHPTKETHQKIARIFEEALGLE